MTDKLNSKISTSRRRFIKKAAYNTPTLVALGLMLKPNGVMADFSGGPDVPPGSLGFNRNQRR